MALNKRIGDRDFSIYDKWYFLCNISDNMSIFVKNTIKGFSFMPVFEHIFKLYQFHFLTDIRMYNSTKNIKDIPLMYKKIRWARCNKQLLQKDVAQYLGINLKSYKSYEQKGKILYPLENIIKLSKLFDVDFKDLMDEYNLFLYNGQSNQIKQFRIDNGITQLKLAELLNIDRHTVSRWECDGIKITKKNWEKLIKLKEFF